MSRQTKATATALPNGRAAVAEPSEPALFESMDRVHSRRTTFLFKGRIPHGRITVVEGDKGVGKSTMLAAIAAATTGGPPLPGGRRQKSNDGVLWLASEEDYESEVKPRLVAAGADIKRVFNPTIDQRSGLRRRLQLPADLHYLSDLVDLRNISLLVCDPWVSLIPAFMPMKDEQAVRSVLEPLGDWCSLHSVTALLARHLSKNRAAPLLDQGLGSVAVGNVARSILRLSQHPQQAGVYALSHVCINGVKKADTLSFEFRETESGVPCLKWLGETGLTAEQLAGEQEEPAEKDAGQDAEQLLRGLLAGEPRPCVEVLREARDAGVPERTLRRAKAKLGIISKRNKTGQGAYWTWGKPPTGFPAK